PDEEEQKMIKKIGFYDWISESQSIDRLREYVVHNLASMNHEKEQARLIFNKEGEVKQDELRAILHVLSKKETAFFEKLLNSNDETVSRTEMSRAIWGDGPNSS
ncbi:helix-turn-helix domain-containing protein, partial [Enterococcus sp. S181_ASV_20]|nr:helix-turn-helix domain-containing protein [Enterococcus sp. S181_ASV_20]